MPRVVHFEIQGGDPEAMDRPPGIRARVRRSPPMQRPRAAALAASLSARPATPATTDVSAVRRRGTTARSPRRR